jgi:heme-degrading monooxygenase HmoA
MCQARMLQLKVKPGQGKKLACKLTQGVLPLVKPLVKLQRGFIDTIDLTSETEPDQLVGVWIWKPKEDADHWINGKGRGTVQVIRTRPISGTLTLVWMSAHRLKSR